ncbi:uncharacterized protein K02A2.6-like [Ylistrum balloti]|uniref:uncharacterized protein K02A2.6-like n=1 Tax=Ylistrum balloti TaxID=509963 RepID=UPI002905C22F|nr:uncharacterized protein K02A2.6-like [Ylistrum balloti]
MEIDTGAAVIICSEKVYTDHLSQLSLQKPTVKLKDYGGVNVPLRGEVTVPVTYGNQSHNLLLRVACGNRLSLLGRNWLSHIKLDWPSIFTVTQSVQSQRIDTSVKELLVKHHKLFQKGLGTIQKFKALVKVWSDVQPIFCKARVVPFSLKEALEKELHRLENEGIVLRVEQSDWATPVVIVPKADKSIRLCGDFKVTVNKCLDEQQYPLPNVEDMFAQLAGGQKFTKLDLSQAYQQLTLDEASEKYLTITTHPGLFRYHRLPFGVASAPAIFQSVMDQILQGVPHTMCRIDDILVTAPSDSEHIKILGEVLRRLEEHHVRLREDKCKFMEDTVEYMSNMVDREGIHSTEAKIEAIKNAPSPTNVSELKSFLGLLNYYGQYMSNLLTKLQPLHELLRQDKSWNWTLQCECAFRSCKDQLSSDRMLVHYDMNKPLRLACDASAYGVGAVISHICDNGEERPIAYASRTLSASEKNYAQVEKEALGLVFGVRKFHNDGKSEELEVYHFTQLNDLPVTSEDVAKGTRGDVVLLKVLDYTLRGWPNYVSDRDLQPFHQRRNELSTEQGCVLWGLRVIIPQAYRERILAQLHEQHVGMSRMKSLARSYLWWPGLDKDIETVVSAFNACQATRKMPLVAPLHSWSWPTHVWQRVHIDFAEKDEIFSCGCGQSL